MPKSFSVSLTNGRGTDAYPIASFTWLLLRRRDFGSAKGEVLADFLRWMLERGEPEAAAEGYAPLPEDIATDVRLALRQPVLKPDEATHVAVPKRHLVGTRSKDSSPRRHASFIHW